MPGRNLHILHIAPSLDPVLGSGPADALARLAKAQLDIHTQVTIVTANGPGTVDAVEKRLVDAGATVRLAGPGGGRWNKGLHVVRAVQDAFAERPDIVHIHAMWQHIPHFGAAEAQRARIPYFFRTCGMLEAPALRKSKWQKRIFEWLVVRRDLSHAAGIHVTAGLEGRGVRARCRSAPVVVLPNGVDLDEYSPGRLDEAVEARWPALRGRRRALFMARIDPIKGTADLAEAWGRLAPESPDWTLVVAGSDWNGHQAVFEAALKKAGVLDRTVFTGPVYGEEKKQLLASCDVFVQPSLQENFGITIAEALASARPVITTKGTPWHELPARACGWWTDHGVDPLSGALAEAMGRSTGELDTMGQRARGLIEERYSWTTIARRHVESYEWALGRRPQPDHVYRADQQIPD
jgi:glycosyltransferase involved in cell wall biosynthesis